MWSELLYTAIAFCSILIVVSILLMYYRYRITKFERKYFELFKYYPSYFIINSYNFVKQNYRDMEKILSYEKRVSYDKDENVNIILNNDSYWTDDCCVSCCSIFSSICCISCCICCRADSKSKISDIFDYRVVMSTNFKNEIVFDLIKHYKQKLDNLVSETKDNEWQLNELTSKLDNKDGILSIINKNKEELESKLESEPLNVLKDLSDIYQKEKMNKRMSSDLENRINILNEKNISNKRETYICREKINELYKYAAMCNLVE